MTTRYASVGRGVNRPVDTRPMDYGDSFGIMQSSGMSPRARGKTASFTRAGMHRSLSFVLVAVAACATSGCGISSLTSGFGSSILGGGSSQTEVASVTEEQLLSAAKSDVNGGADSLSTGAIAAGCPQFIPELREGNVTIYEPGRVGDSLAIMHRGEITKTARECIVEPGRVIVKYGFSGRVLLGPRGKTGPASFPVNIYVTDSARAKVASDTMQVSVDLNVDKPISYFSAVKVIAFDVAQGARPGEYKMYVAFDQKTPGAG